LAEEEAGLSYTIRFIPDVSAIDQSIKDISAKVSKEIKDSVGKARAEAGMGEATGGAGEPSIGVMDRVIGEFRAVKDKITSVLQEVNILGGRARALGHPSSATVGSVVETAAQKIAAGDTTKLSTDQVLQILSGVVVAGGRALAAKQGMPSLSPTEAVEQSIQDQVGSLKDITSQMMGLKEFKSIKGVSNMMRLADFYERSTGAVGASRVKEIEQGLMESFGHDMMQNVMRALMRREMPKAEWEETGMTFRSLAKNLGLSEAEAKGLSYADQEVMDIVRKVGDVLQVGEAKTVGEVTTGVPKFNRDIENLKDLFTRVQTKKKKEGEGFPLRIQAKMYAGAERGAPATEIAGIKGGEFVESVGYENIGAPVRGEVAKDLQDQLPELQRELETLLIDMAPGAAKAHVEQLLMLIEEGLRVLEAHSMPQFWYQIGMERWIRQSAVSYVNTLKGEIEPRLYQTTKDEVFLGISPESAESPVTVGPRSDSERILGMLGIIDVKIDDIRENIPRGSGTPYGSLLDRMKDISEGEG
jgi:hypothetical protein